VFLTLSTSLSKLGHLFLGNRCRDLKLCLTLDLIDGYENLILVSPQVLQNILDTEKEYAKELQSLLVTYLRPLQSNNK
jgi:hypothetical protein